MTSRGGPSATAVLSPPLSTMAAAPLAASGVSDGSFRLKKLSDASSVLDQLHAEQKSTIEALTYQIEFYRQREERAKQELETLRKVAHGEGGDAASVARLATENRALGDEVDGLRAKQSAWQDEKRRLRRRQFELEQQLQDAKLGLTTFTQAIEQLELKMQRRDAEEQTRALEMEQELRLQTQDAAHWKRECDALKHQLENLQTAREENERLRREIQTLAQQSSTQQSQVEASTIKTKAELEELQRRLSDAEATSRQREITIVGLQTRLVEATSNVSVLRVDVEKKVADIRELTQKLERSAELLELREKLLASDASSRQERESQHQELRHQISNLEQENSSLRQKLASSEQQFENARREVESMKSRLMAKDHGVLVATLRSEIVGVKERLRAEFKSEKEALVSENASLTKDIALLTTRLAEKERFVLRLQDDLLGKESDEQRTTREISTLKSTIRRLEAEIVTSQNRYQEVLNARSSLAEQLDSGFKELLEDENTASSLLRQVEKLQRDLSDAKHSLAASEARRTGIVDELQAVQLQHESVSSSLRKKIDELYEELRQRDEQALGYKKLETQIYLLEQEKSNYESNLAALRTQLETQQSAEKLTADHLHAVILSLKAEKEQQVASVTALNEEISKRELTISELKGMLTMKEVELDESSQGLKILQERVRLVQSELDEARTTISSCQDEKGKRERKLLRERRALEEQVGKLVDRIEHASTKNTELGDKVVALMKQLKGCEAEVIAVETQLKAEKSKRGELERALATVRRSAGQSADSSEELKRRLHELTSLKESYQGEVHQLKRSLERVHKEKDVLHRQRDEAIKRVSTLMKCQEQMKSTIESHTAELVEEIEAIQGQLDDERRRTTAFLANEKTLLRDISEKNSTIEKLQQTIATLQQEPPAFAPTIRKRSLADERSTSFPMSVSPTSRPIPTTPKTTNSSTVSSSAQELDRILGNLERISEFAPGRSPSASFSR